MDMGRKGRSIFLSAILGILLAAGCGQSSQSPAPSATPVSPGTETQATNGTGAPVSTSSESGGTAKETSETPVVQGRWVTVQRVVDGDTVELADGEKVRMIGVNTPETVKPNTPQQPFGKEASDFTKKMLQGKRVFLELDVQQRDQYGRLLGYLYLQPPRTLQEIEEKMFNAILVREGYAQVMTIPPNVKYADLFVRLQREARAENRGLWALGIYKDQVKSTNDVFQHTR